MLSRTFKSLTTFVVILACVVFIPACSNSAPPTAGGGTVPTVGSVAPGWMLYDPINEVFIKLSDFQGKVVVLDFWATWCGPCKVVMPHLQELHENFAAQGVEVIGISVWERGGDPGAYMEGQGFNYRLVVEGGDVAVQYGVSAIPTMLVIDKTGMVTMIEVGAGDPAKLVQAVEKALGG